ncbi:MAG: hypothetical protein WC289_04555, partial [Patescibacteria group bacterium]
VVITRRIYRDGTGEYLINKNKVRLHDILLLLAKSHFGQRAYSVIGQGMIDAILVSSPAERKQFFEEAAGIRQYQIKKEQAETKLKATHENLQQAEMLVAEIEPRLRSLTRQVRKLEQREEHEKRLRELQMEYYSGLWAELGSRHADVEKSMKEADEAKVALEQEVKKLNTAVEQLTSREGRSSAFAKLETEYQALIDEKNRVVRDVTILKGRADVLREKKGEMNLVWLEKRRDDLRANVRRFQGDIGRLQSIHKDVTSRFNAKQSERERLDRNIEELETDLSEVKKGLHADPSVTALNLHGELKTLIAEQEDFVRDLGAVSAAEDIAKLRQVAERISGRLHYIVEKSRKLSAKDPNALLKIQEKLSETFKAHDTLLSSLAELGSEQSVAEANVKAAQESLRTTTADLESVERDLEHLTSQDPQQVVADQKALEEQVHGIEQKIVEVQQRLAAVGTTESTKQQELLAVQREVREKQEVLNAATSKHHEIQIEFAKLETRKEDLDHEMTDELKDADREIVYQSKHPASLNESLVIEIQKEKRNLELIGGIDEGVSTEYQETKHRYDFLATQIADLRKASEDLYEAIENLDQTMKKQFDLAFEKINLEFGKYFKTLFEGGTAKLTLIKEEIVEEEEEEDEEEGDEDEEDAEEEEVKPVNKRKGEKVLTGVDIQATPPGKRVKSIAMLSGGERALTSIALISAIISSNPSPFVILDEVDAALDESNSMRFAQIIERLSHETQFIAITHNRATMHKAHILYGVTMGDDSVSRLLSVKMDQAEKVLENRG